MSRGRSAFTLLEILVSLALVGMIFLAMNTFIFSMGELWGRNTDVRLFDQHVNAVTRFLAQTIATATYPPSARPNAAPVYPEQISPPSGSPDNLLTFDLPAGLRLLNWPDRPLPEVTCSLQVRPNDGLYLLWHSRLEMHYGDDPPREVKLTPFCTGFGYDYYDDNFKKWTTNTALQNDTNGQPTPPQRLRLYFQYGKLKRERVVPIPAAVQGTPVYPVKSRPASILVIVLITLILTAAALVAFLDKASNDLLVAARASQADRLRPDAYSALEVVLGVLEDFRGADNGLRHPSEGWGDPLAWAGWAPADGYTVDVQLQDESGKIPLRSATTTELMNLFQYWGMAQPDAQKMTESIYGWMHQNYTPTSALDTDYEQAAIPYDPPYRPIRSIGELAAIDNAKDYFYTNGLPNAWWWRFYNDFSIYNYARPNVNGANSDVLTAVGQLTLEQEQGIASYLAGTSDRVTLNRTWFQSNTDLQGVVGQSGTISGFGYTAAALRILITVHDGKALFRLLAVVAPTAGGGANTVETTASDVKQSQQNAQNGETNNNQSVTNAAAPTVVPNTAQTSAAASVNIRYPFRFLALEENENIPEVPPVPVPEAPDPGAPPLNPFSPVVPPLPNQ